MSKISTCYGNKKEENSLKSSSLVNLCKYMTNSRTFIDDYIKIIDFIDYLKYEHTNLYNRYIKSH